MKLTFLVMLLQVLRDGGNYYAETNLNYIIVEPWNAASSLIFLIPVFYWLHKLRGQYQNYLFLTFCMPLLFLGGLGSTFYHAFRSSYFLLLLDVLPILVLTASLSIYFWIKILPDWRYIFVLFVPYFVMQFFLNNYLPAAIAMNINYFIRGVMMFLPAMLLLRKIHYRYVSDILMAILFFGLALMFRFLDHEASQIMYMGSHWLWHICTTIGSFYIAEFLYKYASLEKELVYVHA